VRRPDSIPLSVLGGGTLAGIAALGWAAGFEVRSFRLRRLEVPVLAPGARPLRVLHITDLHMTPGQRKKREWVRALAGLEPDLVIDTGDNLAHVEAVPAVLDAFGPLLERPGAFVMGSNDYYRPTFKNPGRYLLPDRDVRIHAGALPAEDLREGLRLAGPGQRPRPDQGRPPRDRAGRHRRPPHPPGPLPRGVRPG
jgi:predicted MPP superfamily phosphohydrolase